jgi:hypothetical protein
MASFNDAYPNTYVACSITQDENERCTGKCLEVTDRCHSSQHYPSIFMQGLGKTAKPVNEEQDYYAAIRTRKLLNTKQGANHCIETSDSVLLSVCILAIIWTLRHGVTK